MLYKNDRHDFRALRFSKFFVFYVSERGLFTQKQLNFKNNVVYHYLSIYFFRSVIHIAFIVKTNK